MSVIVRGKILYIDFSCYLPDGRRVRCKESTGLTDTKKNRQIVEAKHKAIQYELKHGRFDYLHFFPYGSKAKHFREQKEGVLFSDFWNEWIEERSLRKGTYTNELSVYKVHLGPAFGHRFLHQITESDLLVFRKALQQKGLKASYINDRIMKPLCMALRKAHRRDLIDSYPCDEIKPLSEDPVDIDPFTFEELRAFLEALQLKRPVDHDMILIWSRTGLRPGELFALKWKNVDYFNRKILIRETRYRNWDGPPKTRYSIRDVDMRPDVHDALKRQEARTGLQGGYVFLTDGGKPFEDFLMRNRFRFLLRLAGMKYRPPKHLRHTFATLHIAAGENISWVSRTLGHSSVEITLKRYNRFIPNLTREDGSAFEKIMYRDRRKWNNHGTPPPK